MDTWASTAAGAFALSENNLYTTDAFRDYLNHLTDDGLMVFTRWGFEPPRESLRLLSLAIEALGEVGRTERLEDTSWCCAIMRRISMLLARWIRCSIFRKPLSGCGCRRRESGIEPDQAAGALYCPGALYHKERPPTNSASCCGAPIQPTFWRNYRYNVTPVDDDRPFFFYTVQPRDILNFLKAGRALGGLQNQSRAAVVV